MFDFFKKKSSEKNGSKTKLSESEIEQLKQELEQKKEEFRSLYNELIEAGGTELPEDILEVISGGRNPGPSYIDEHAFVTEVFNSDTWRG